MLFAPLVFLVENGVLAGQVVGQRDEIIASGLLGLALPLDCFFISFDIFREQVFPADLIEISEMIDPFLREEPDLIESVRDELLLAPVDIPIIIFGLSITPPLEGVRYAITEECFEFNIRAEWS